MKHNTKLLDSWKIFLQFLTKIRKLKSSCLKWPVNLPKFWFKSRSQKVNSNHYWKTIRLYSISIFEGSLFSKPSIEIIHFVLLFYYLLLMEQILKKKNIIIPQSKAILWHANSFHIVKLFGLFATEPVPFHNGSNLRPGLDPRSIVRITLNLVVPFFMLSILLIIVYRNWLDPGLGRVLGLVNQAFHCISLRLSMWGSGNVSFCSAISQVSNCLFLRSASLDLVNVFVRVFVLNLIVLFWMKSFLHVGSLVFIPRKYWNFGEFFIIEILNGRPVSAVCYNIIGKLPFIS